MRSHLSFHSLQTPKQNKLGISQRIKPTKANTNNRWNTQYGIPGNSANNNNNNNNNKQTTWITFKKYKHKIMPDGDSLNRNI